jgi:hypothetical protein
MIDKQVTDADRNIDFAIMACEKKRFLCQAIEKTLLYSLSVYLGFCFNYPKEFVSIFIAKNSCRLAKMISQTSNNLREDSISGRIGEGIVYFGETVDIQKEQRPDKNSAAPRPKESLKREGITASRYGIY